MMEKDRNEILSDLNKRIEAGKDVQSTISSPGWKIFRDLIEEEVLKLKTLDVYPDRLKDVQVRYTSALTLKKVLDQYEGVIEDANQAAKQLAEYQGD